MILEYKSNQTIQDKKELLSWFYPKVNANQNIMMNNSGSKLIKMTTKNPALSRMIDKLDLREV